MSSRLTICSVEGQSGVAGGGGEGDETKVEITCQEGSQGPHKDVGLSPASAQGACQDKQSDAARVDSDRAASACGLEPLRLQ